MCNINIILRRNIEKDILPFLMGITSHSYVNNNDGEGFYLNYGDTHKLSKEKINYYDFEKEIKESNIILTHQRRTTSGEEIIYNHPFINSEFVLMHNGIINQFKKDIGSDTYGLWVKFNNLFEEYNKTTDTNKQRERTINKIIQELFKEDIGTYSIFIYDRKTKKSYYFKDSTTKIYFYKSKDYLYITTSAINEYLLTLIKDEKFKELNYIKERVIYVINGIDIKVLSKLPKSKITYTTPSYYGEYDYLDSSEWKKDNIKDFINSGKTTQNNTAKDGLTDEEIIKNYWLYDMGNFNPSIMDYCDMCNSPLMSGVYFINNFMCCSTCCLSQYKKNLSPKLEGKVKK